MNTYVSRSKTKIIIEMILVVSYLKSKEEEKDWHTPVFSPESYLLWIWLEQFQTQMVFIR